MIEYKQGDLLAENADALVNTVNCVGVMGRGIALQFKRVWPENFKAYAAACRREEAQPGRMFVFETQQLTPPRYIINFPTKRHWRGKSRIEDIEAGLLDLVAVVRARGIRSIAIPPLGAGLGGLDWNEVRPRIERAMGELAELKVIVFEPQGVPERSRGARTKSAPSLTQGRAAPTRGGGQGSGATYSRYVPPSGCLLPLESGSRPGCPRPFRRHPFRSTGRDPHCR